MNKSYKEIRESQNEIRIRLTNYVTQNHLTQPEVSREIGISAGTIAKFLTHGKDVSFVTLANIIGFLNKHCV